MPEHQPEPKTPQAEPTLRELRSPSNNQGIPNYGRMHKAQLKAYQAVGADVIKALFRRSEQ
jgi:hypothetical protein